MTADICADASIIHHPDNPAQDRIFIVEDKRIYYLPNRGNVNWRETNIDIGLELSDGNREPDYDELFWSSDDEDESSNNVELTLTERHKVQKLNQDEHADNEGDILRDELATERTKPSVDGQITAEECTTPDQIQVYEYLDDVIFYGNQHTMKGTDC